MSLVATGEQIHAGDRWSVGYSIYTLLFRASDADVRNARALEGKTLEGAYTIEGIAYAQDSGRLSVNIRVLKTTFRANMVAAVKKALEQAGDFSLYTDWIKNLQTGTVEKNKPSPGTVTVLREKATETVSDIEDTVKKTASAASDFFGFKYAGYIALGLGLIAVVYFLKSR